MTDKDIIKTLECCIKHECTSCSLNKMFCSDTVAIEYALELINRQQAEIERLKKHNTEVAYKHYNDGIKEFAERLKDKSLTKWDYHEAVDVEEIDNLVKEMVGED